MLKACATLCKSEISNFFKRFAEATFTKESVFYGVHVSKNVPVKNGRVIEAFDTGEVKAKFYSHSEFLEATDFLLFWFSKNNKRYKLDFKKETAETFFFKIAHNGYAGTPLKYVHLFNNFSDLTIKKEEQGLITGLVNKAITTSKPVGYQKGFQLLVRHAKDRGFIPESDATDTKLWPQWLTDTVQLAFDIIMAKSSVPFESNGLLCSKNGEALGDTDSKKANFQISLAFNLIAGIQEQKKLGLSKYSQDTLTDVCLNSDINGQVGECFGDVVFETVRHNGKEVLYKIANYATDFYAHCIDEKPAIFSRDDSRSENWSDLLKKGKAINYHSFQNDDDRSAFVEVFDREITIVSVPNSTNERKQYIHGKKLAEPIKKDNQTTEIKKTIANVSVQEKKSNKTSNPERPFIKILASDISTVKKLKTDYFSNKSTKITTFDNVGDVEEKPLVTSRGSRDREEVGGITLLYSLLARNATRKFTLADKEKETPKRPEDKKQD